QCGFHPAALPREELGPQLVRLGHEWREFLLHVDDQHLRTNPEPGDCSPPQYGAHVRELLGVYVERISRALVEDNPTFEAFNPSDDVWASYNRLDVGELADEIDSNARRLADVLGALGPHDWERTMVRDGGKDGVYTFTVV